MLLGGTVFSIAAILSRFDVLSIPAGKAVAGLFPVIIFIVVHWHYVSAGRYLKALQAFDKSNNRFRSSPGVIVGLVLGVSLILLFSVWGLLAKLK